MRTPANLPSQSVKEVISFAFTYVDVTVKSQKYLIISAFALLAQAK